jgi:hypothetical protein
MSTTQIQTNALPVATQTVIRAEIDTDLVPVAPATFPDLVIETHQKMGRVTIELQGDELFIGGKKVAPYRSDCQKKHGQVCHELREELTGKLVLNACVLDFLIKNKSFIPNSWKEKAEGGDFRKFFFWGTVWNCSKGLMVRYLYFYQEGDSWADTYRWCDNRCFDWDPAALLEEPVS